MFLGGKVGGGKVNWEGKICKEGKIGKWREKKG
jgi:hypothetical protein